MAELTNADVVEALENNISGVEATTSENAGGVTAVIPPSEIGWFFDTVRDEGFDYEASRVGANLHVEIPASETESGLIELFQ